MIDDLWARSGCFATTVNMELPETMYDSKLEYSNVRSMHQAHKITLFGDESSQIWDFVLFFCEFQKSRITCSSSAHSLQNSSNLFEHTTRRLLLLQGHSMNTIIRIGKRLT